MLATACHCCVLDLKCLVIMVFCKYVSKTEVCRVYLNMKLRLIEKDNEELYSEDNFLDRFLTSNFLTSPLVGMLEFLSGVYSR